jgi:hypothetical protein
MLLSKNTLQNFFLIILAITVSLNASINPLLIQVSSISFIVFFLFCLKNNETSESIKINYINNKSFFLIFIIYLSYLVFKIIPLPLNWIEIMAPKNYDLYSSIKIDKEFWPLSIDPSSSYFSILNCINYLIIFTNDPGSNS